MSQYSLVTRWHLDAPIERVWETLVAVENWPRWWRFVRNVAEIEKGNPDGTGSLRHLVWSGRLPYRLAFRIRTTAVSRPSFIEGVAAGELNGVGRCHLTAIGVTTLVQYEWTVSISKRWMKLLAPFLDPAFRWNHHQVMAEGGRGLARYLGVSLINVEDLSRK